MKIKLLKIQVFTEEYSLNYDDDYGDIKRHLVKDISDFEEVSQEQRTQVEGWVSNYNIQNRKTGNYIMIVSDEKFAISKCIKEMEREARLEEEKNQQRIKELEQKRLDELKNKEELTKKKLEKQLAKIQAKLAKTGK